MDSNNKSELFLQRNIKEIVGEALERLDKLSETYDTYHNSPNINALDNRLLSPFFYEIRKLRTIIDTHHDSFNEDTSKAIFWYVILSYLEVLAQLNLVRTKEFNESELKYNIKDFLKYICESLGEDYSKLEATSLYPTGFGIGITLTNSVLMRRLFNGAYDETFEKWLRGEGGMLCLLSKGLMGMGTWLMDLKEYCKRNDVDDNKLINMLIEQCGYVSVPPDSNIITTLPTHIHKRLKSIEKKIEESDGSVNFEEVYITLDDMKSNFTTLKKFYKDLESQYPYAIIKQFSVVLNNGSIWKLNESRMIVPVNKV
ncbi:MAG: hypothetical protein ABIM99_04350 [Candidatus Dojkabacteria bacterium]